MPPLPFNLVALRDAIERRHDQSIATYRYNAEALEGFITPRWKTKKRMKVEFIDFNRDGAGLIVPVPIWEKGDEVSLSASATDKPELTLDAMPATVRYRIKWGDQYRVGLQFHPHKALFRDGDVRLQARAVESYLAEINGRSSVSVVDGLALDNAISANEPV
jgi:hypothetical protein